MKTIQLNIRQGQEQTTRPAIDLALNFTEKVAELSNIYALHHLPWVDNETIECTIWIFEDNQTLLKHMIRIKPEKVHGIYEIFTIYVGQEVYHVTDSFSESLNKAEKLLREKVGELL